MTLPAIAVSQNEGCAITRHLAVQWVQGNFRKIRERAALFLRYSPYDMEDFIQQAYAAALTAADVSRIRNIPFEACFWVLFTADSRQMASNPATRNCFREFREDYSEEGYAPTSIRKSHQHAPYESRDEDGGRVLTDEFIAKALSVMTARQREVWSYLLNKRYYSTNEIARALNVKRQVIEELREAGLRRVRRHSGDRP